MLNKQTLLTAILAAMVICGSCVRADAQIELLPDPRYWYNNVGATDFDPTDAIPISKFCSGRAEEDSTACARRWMQAGRESGRHLIAYKGTFTLSAPLYVFDGMHIRCSSPIAVTFRKTSGSIYPHFTNLRLDDGDPISHVANVMIENCGFDVNGDASNYGSSFALGDAEQVTFRGNRVFDSTGTRCRRGDCQRYHVLIKSGASDVLVENNRLSEGGRIKAGLPGRRIVIRNNLLDFVNDNGISVVGKTGATWADGTNITEDILIDGNRVTDAILNGIAFGSDGELAGVGVTTRRVTIINNRIEGTTKLCIDGKLTDQASEIFIANNRCRQHMAGKFGGGIGLGRANDTTGTARSSTMVNNRVEPREPTTLDSYAFFVKPTVEACLLDNVVRNSALAARFGSGAIVYLNGNDWGGGVVTVDAGARVEELDTEGRERCFVPEFVRRDSPPPPPPPTGGSCLVGVPIDPDPPICRCLRYGLLEFRCRFEHPDFVLERRVAVPLVAGERFEEVWEFTSIRTLSAPVRVTFSGVGIAKSIAHTFGLKSKKEKMGTPERFVVKGIVPKERESVEGRATIEYKPTDPTSKLGTKFIIDRSFNASMFSKK